jgi:hypothetical protein
MKAIRFIIIALFLTASLANAQDTLYVYRSGAVVYKSLVAEIDSITFAKQYSGNQIFTQAVQDSIFAKIYATLGLTGNIQPAGDPDIVGIDEGQTDFFRQIWVLNELTTDEAICAWTDPGIPELNLNNWTNTNVQIQGLFSRLYFNITLCNKFISLSASKTDGSSLRQRAEARFMRALNYYYLLDMFGHVPFTEGSTYTSSLQISRADLFTYIENELIACETNMYEALQAPYGRADKVANWLLRSRLYLNAQVYTGTARWTDAAVYAKKVMDSGYTLCPTYKYLFMADNDNSGTVNTARQEIILPIYANGIKAKSWGSSLFLIASTHTSGMAAWGSTAGWGGNRARATLIKKFFPTGTASFTNEADLTTATLASFKDNRALFDKKSVSVGLNITTPANFNEGYQVIKFSNIRADGAATSDIQFTDMDVPLFRIAEAYLTYAEAVTRGASPINGYTALSAVNTLRTRAGATSVTSMTLQNIIDEKAREFFFEGQRRTDLIRFGQYGGTNTYTWDWEGGTAAGTNFDTHLNVFPIPQAELIANGNLFQNSGY